MRHRKKSDKASRRQKEGEKRQRGKMRDRDR